MPAPSVAQRSASGHLERFPPERLSGRCRIDQETSAGAYSGDGLAPKADLERRPVQISSAGLPFVDARLRHAGLGRSAAPIGISGSIGWLGCVTLPAMAIFVSLVVYAVLSSRRRVRPS